MEKWHLPELKIIDEFKRLAPPISEEDFRKLTQDITERGCLEPIRIWRNIILDGHKRYEICRSSSIPFTVKKVPLRDRNDIILWICTNHLRKPYIFAETQMYLIGKQYSVEKIYNIPNIINASPERGHKRFHKSPFSVTSAQVKETLAKKYNISQGTILKYEQYAIAIDILWENVPELAHKVLAGEIKISQDNIIRLSRLPEHDSERLKQLVSGNIRLFAKYNEIQKFFPKENSQMHTPPISDDIGGIKNMPSFDPDAEISSLTLTIPSWINSIHRTHISTDTKTITKDAHFKLRVQLIKLKESINLILTSMEEDNNE